MAELLFYCTLYGLIYPHKKNYIKNFCQKKTA